jgi:ADP-L-glycero-D-manno-heptose 6-epimerase
MIVVTGSEGFIGKNLIVELKRQGNNVIGLDTKVESLNSIYAWLTTHAKEIDCIYHLGAITDTMEMSETLFNKFNLTASIFIWNLCTKNCIPLIYASSAATYGDGKLGFDDEKDISNLYPLNPYGWSKQQFDVWIKTVRKKPPYWYGLKFFNVYGHGEEHKGKMASTIFQFFNQATTNGRINLFKSYVLEYNNGEQLRDFIYVDDVVNVCIHLIQNKPTSGIYNVGTGKARSFNDLARAVFNSLGIPENISYIDTPIKIRDKYQYFTEAETNKLRYSGGYTKMFHELENGVSKYVKKLQNENS